MLNILRNTRLYQQLSETLTEYRAVKRAEYRAALKYKRTAVKARIRAEIQRAQLEQLCLHLEATRTLARVQAARAGTLHHTAERGDANADEQFKQGAIKAVEEILPKQGVVSKMAAQVLRQSVHGISLDGELPKSAQLVAGVAKQTGVAWDELEKMVNLVEKDEEGRRMLKQVMRQAMEEEETRAAGVK